jgi:large subunit ribosomal protein L6
MSRIGNKHIILPEGVSIKVEGNNIAVSGKSETLNIVLPHKIHLEVKDGKTVILTRDDDEMLTKEIHGTTRALIHDAVVGVSTGFSKSLLLKGTGFRARVEGNKLILKVGFSHEVPLEIIPGCTVKVVDKDATELLVSGADKQKVGQLAAVIRDVRRPEPYNGTGIRYKNEYVPHKEGKRAAAATAGAPAAK